MKTLREPGDFSLWKKIWGKINSVIRFGGKKKKKRRLLRVPWTARRSNESIQKEINSEYSPEGLMLKLKLQYFGHLMRKAK